MVGSLVTAYKMCNHGSTNPLGKFQRRQVADTRQVALEPRLESFSGLSVTEYRRGSQDMPRPRPSYCVKALQLKYLLWITRRYKPGLKLRRKRFRSTLPRRHLVRLASAHWRQRERENRLSVTFVFSYFTLGVEKYKIQLPNQAQ